MAFPTIPTAAASRVLTANQLNTTATRTFPDLSGLTNNAGDLMVAIIVAYQTGTGTDAAFSGWSGGFTEFHDSATSTTLAMGAAYKWSTGSETGAITVTQAGAIVGDASMILLSIPGAHATTPPEAGSRASGTTAVADPAAFNPTGWDVADTLWISVVGSGMTAAGGTWTATGTTPPTNFTDWVDTNAADTSTIGDCEAAVSFRQDAAASEDVGPASAVDVSNAINGALVIAVRPAPATLTGDAALAATATIGAAGFVTAISGASLAATTTATAAGDVTAGGATQSGDAVLNVTATITAAAEIVSARSAAVPVTTPSGGTTVTGDAALTATATLTAAGFGTQLAGASLAATATIGAAGVPTYITGATVSATATATTAGFLTLASGAALVGTATVTTAGLVGGIAVLSVTATVTVTGFVVQSAGAAFVGTAAITAAGFLVLSSGATSVATATITTAGPLGLASGAALVGTATVTAAAAISVLWGPPSGLTVTPFSDTRLDLSWVAMPGASGYDIERDAVVIATNVVGTTYSDTGLAPASTHTYRARSVRA